MAVPVRSVGHSTNFTTAKGLYAHGVHVYCFIYYVIEYKKETLQIATEQLGADFFTHRRSARNIEGRVAKNTNVTMICEFVSFPPFPYFCCPK